MALLWMDNFENYGTSRSAFYGGEGYVNLGQNMNYAVTTVSGRVCGMTRADLWQDFPKFVNTTADTIGVAARFYFPIYPNGIHPGMPVLSVDDCYLIMDTNGYFWVGADPASKTVQITNTPFPQNVFHHLELIFTRSTGAFQVYWQNTLLGSGTIATRPLSGTYARVGGGNPKNLLSTSTGYMYYTDFIVWDSSGTVNNSRIGDKRVVTLTPAAAGSLQDWTASSGTALSTIDKTTPNDTTYLEATANGNVSTFTLDALGQQYGDIRGVQIISRLAKSDAGENNTKITVSSGGVDASVTTKVPGTAFGFVFDVVERDPNTSNLWSRTALNSALLKLIRTL